MQKRGWLFSIIIIITFAVVGSALSLIFEDFIDLSKAGGKDIVTKPIPPIPKKRAQKVTFNPPSLNDAPDDLKAAILLGYNILTKTSAYAGDYIEAKLSCSSCHFQGGMTDGGKNGGISLVGVASQYPKWEQRDRADIDLLTRTNNCFERSMNGKPLPLNSKEMNALLTYYQWISKGLPIYGTIPWLGLSPINGGSSSNVDSGKITYQKCAPCHGRDGGGTPDAPPLWGPASFNAGAGMSEQPVFASFVLLNMPRANPDLSTQQALDVAAFVTSQPRPEFHGAQ